MNDIGHPGDLNREIAKALQADADDQKNQRVQIAFDCPWRDKTNHTRCNKDGGSCAARQHGFSDTKCPEGLI